MAKNGTLYVLGKILGLISGVLSIVSAILSLLKIDTFGNLRVGPGFGNSIVDIVVSILCIVVCIDRISIKDALALGIVVLILGLLGAGWIAVLGGILIILDKLIKN